MCLLIDDDERQSMLSRVHVPSSDLQRSAGAPSYSLTATHRGKYLCLSVQVHEQGEEQKDGQEGQRVTF